MRTKLFGDTIEGVQTKTLFKMEYELGRRHFNNCLDLIDADNKSHGKKFCTPCQVENIRKRVDEYEQQGISLFDYKLPINGNDIMEILDIPPSRKVKECLQWVMKFVYNNPVISRKELLKQIKQYKRYDK